MDGSDLAPEQSLALIKDQLQEVLKEDIIEDVILKQKRPLVVYWGTATTGRPHCGYFVPMMKIAHFLRAGCRVKILLADVHGFLDNLKAPIELVKFRAEYYQFIVKALLKAIGVSLDKLEFVFGSSYQLSSDYTMDLFRLSTVVTEHDAKKAGSEVVKQVENATLSGLIYPLMQSLDEQYLGVDAQFGGVDQRKIFALAQEVLPKIGYKERAHLMNAMVPGLAGGKMSASDPDSKIDILDNAEIVKKKLRKAYAAPKEVEGNGLISFIEYVLLPVSALNSKDGKGEFVVERGNGQDPVAYTNIEEFKADYIADKTTPQLLKSAITTALNKLLEPIQAEYQASPEWQEIEKKAYPPAEPAKKKKQPKDKGSKYPGANITTEADGSIVGKEKGKEAVGTSADDAMSKLAINGHS